MRALNRCDFCAEQAAGTFEIVPEELDPTEAERRRVVLCDSCRAQLETLIEPLLDRAGAATTTPDREESAPTAVEETDEESESLIGESEDGSLLGGESDASEDTDEEPSGTDETEAVHSTEADSEGPPENYGKVLRLLRNREFPMGREEVVTVATSAYSLSARNVQQIIDEAIDRGEFVERGGQLERA